MKMEWRSLPAPARLISLIAEIKIKILFHSSTQSYFYNINLMKFIKLKGLIVFLLFSSSTALPFLSSIQQLKFVDEWNEMKR